MDRPLFAALHLPIDAAALFLRKINASYINFSGWFHWFSLISSSRDFSVVQFSHFRCCRCWFAGSPIFIFRAVVNWQQLFVTLLFFLIFFFLKYVPLIKKAVERVWRTSEANKLWKSLTLVFMVLCMTVLEFNHPLLSVSFRKRNVWVSETIPD